MDGGKKRKRMLDRSVAAHWVYARVTVGIDSQGLERPHIDRDISDD